MSSDQRAPGEGDPVAADRPRKPRRPELTPVQRALGMLTRREHSSRELTRKLAARGIATDQAKAAVDRLAAAGWQDDRRFAQALVRSRAGSGYGPLRIRAELATHGLDREAIAAAMDTFEGDWAGIAGALIERRYGADVAADRVLQRKAADFLIRRGFSVDQARAATGFDPGT